MQFPHLSRLLITSISIASLALVGCGQQREFGTQPEVSPQAQQPAVPSTVQVDRDVPYVPTPDEVVVRMLELANVSEDDRLYDLGSGDGRIVITAAQQYGTRGTGVEIDPELVERSRQNAEAAGVSDQVEFLQQDLFETDFSDASVVTLYLLPQVNLQLKPRLLEELEPGTRIVSHDFDMGGWEPEEVVQVQGPSRTHTLYYWVVPEEVPANLQQG